MKAHTYHPLTREYLHTLDLAPDTAGSTPQEPKWQTPPWCLLQAPPALAAHQVAVAQADGSGWEVKADYRDATLYSTATGARAVITEIGLTPESIGATLLTPQETDSWDAASHSWQPDPVKLNAALKARKAAALTRANAAYTAAIERIKAGYPADEVLSWDKQESEARAWLANNSTAAPFISALASARGVPLALLAQKIIDKANAWAQTVGALTGQRQAREDQLAAIPDTPDATHTYAQIMAAADAIAATGA